MNTTTTPVPNTLPHPVVLYFPLVMIMSVVPMVLPCRIGCPRPSPPAPEGWDKELTLDNLALTTTLIYTSSLLSSCYTLVLYQLVLRAAVLLLCCIHVVLSLVPMSSPSAPEGWDKGITQHHQGYNIITLHTPGLSS